MSLGQMPGATNVAQRTPLPDGISHEKVYIVAVRVLRNSGQYTYTDVGGGDFCTVYLDNSGYINLAAKPDGVTYCSGQAVGAILGIAE